MHMRAGKSKFCRVSYRWRSGEPMVSIKFEGSLPNNSLLLGGAALFVLFLPSNNWLKLTHIIEGNLLIKIRDRGRVC